MVIKDKDLSHIIIDAMHYGWNLKEAYRQARKKGSSVRQAKIVVARLRLNKRQRKREAASRQWIRDQFRISAKERGLEKRYFKQFDYNF